MAYNANYDREKWNRLHNEIEEETLAVQRKLIGNSDAKVWAEEFVKVVNLKPTIATDEGTMIGWFANAIMAGYDFAKKNN